MVYVIPGRLVGFSHLNLLKLKRMNHTVLSCIIFCLNLVLFGHSIFTILLNSIQSMDPLPFLRVLEIKTGCDSYKLLYIVFTTELLYCMYKSIHSAQKNEVFFTPIIPEKKNKTIQTTQPHSL